MFKLKSLAPIIIYLLTAASLIAIGVGILVLNNLDIQLEPIVNYPAVNGSVGSGQSGSSAGEPVLPAGQVDLPPSQVIIPPDAGGAKACTLEAKQCPDGSYVGRTGPNCEFTACPAINSTAGNICSGSGDVSCGKGYQCIQDCGAPVARDTDPIPPYHCLTDEQAAKPRMCPICLASNVLIDTPDGKISVTQITKGMKVWSVDENSNKVASSVIEVIKTPVPKTHQVVHLILIDNREVWVSANHPLSNGLAVGSLKVGDSYDGSNVKVAELVQYWDSFTYDILPDSGTGAYFANGIMLGSTLSKK